MNESRFISPDTRQELIVHNGKHVLAVELAKDNWIFHMARDNETPTTDNPVMGVAAWSDYYGLEDRHSYFNDSLGFNTVCDILENRLSESGRRLEKLTTLIEESKEILTHYNKNNVIAQILKNQITIMGILKDRL